MERTNRALKSVCLAASAVALVATAGTALATESVSMAFSKPTNTKDTTVTVHFNPGGDVSVAIPVDKSAEWKRNAIRDALIAKGFDVSGNDAGGNQLTIKHLANGTKVTFDPGATGEKKDDVVGKNVREAKIDYQGSFDPIDPAGLPAAFTAGITTDLGELTVQVTAEELNFQTDGPIICQALFQRLAPQAPHYGAQINFAGDRLEVYFDPAYTTIQGGISFGTSSLSPGCTGSVTLAGSGCIADFNGDGFINGDDFDLFASAFEAGSPLADLNNDGFVNGDDYDLFASAFEGGC
jgi:hypothetical protein